jgi:hypothetical protein
LIVWCGPSHSDANSREDPPEQILVGRFPGDLVQRLRAPGSSSGIKLLGPGLGELRRGAALASGHSNASRISRSCSAASPNAAYASVQLGGI